MPETHLIALKLTDETLRVIDHAAHHMACSRPDFIALAAIDLSERVTKMMLPADVTAFMPAI